MAKLYEFCIHAFKINEDYQFPERGFIADIAFGLGIIILPHPRSLSKKCDIEDICFVGIDERLSPR